MHHIPGETFGWGEKVSYKEPSSDGLYIKTAQAHPKVYFVV